MGFFFDEIASRCERFEDFDTSFTDSETAEYAPIAVILASVSIV